MARRSSPDGILTEVELELMHIVWDVQGGTVREVMALLPAERTVAYTTVSTILRILHKKGFVDAVPEGRSHRYVPTVSREAYRERGVSDVVQRVFGGDAVSLVRSLVRAQSLDDRALQALRDLLDEEGA